MSWHPRERRPTFDRARRKEAYKRLARTVRKDEKQVPLLPLDEVRGRLGLFEQTYVGIHPIPVTQIVGSADQSRDFDRNWLPLREDVKQRWEQVERAFPAGDFPPIIVYQVDDAYFVVDGHHRVAVAHRKGVEMIDAEITRLHSRVALPADTDIPRLLLAEQERLFLERSGLATSKPGVRIAMSRAHGYLELLELIEAHGYHLVQEGNQVVGPADASADWYERIYEPTVAVIREEGLPDLLPGNADGDLFLWVYERRRTLFPERSGLTLEEAARDATAEQRERAPKRPRRPRSDRGSG